MPSINRQILFAEKPTGKLTPDTFRAADAPIPSPGEGEVLLKTRYVSLDAANRAWMMGPTYRPALVPGEVMAGLALAEVVESRTAGFSAGDIVQAETGWQEYAALPASQLLKLPPAEPLTYLLSVYGITGLTAYFGLLEVGQAKAGETVVVSAAAGAVGSFVGQIAKLKDCRTVGIAGGPEKCALLTEKLGFDAAVDYKPHVGSAYSLYGALQSAIGGGIDVYFDNTGGEILDACLFSMNLFGRVAACGAISMYDGTPPHGVRGVASVISKRITIRGFVVMDYAERWPAAVEELRGWVESGQIKVYEDVMDGLDSLPDALIGLLAGDNIGKRMVKVA